ncbi:MAG TPA: ATP-dependent DNA helicase [Mycobacteriales bacterium]|nr:ATP-dependent DNA helicase [Mycobacteriales bacterium]
MSPSSPAYRLVRAAVEPTAPPTLDERQQSVVAHDSGPLLVLAGPGTGKTTTLVEAVATRITEGADPDRVLVLTFSRKAADELRERIAARVGRTVAEPAAFTFHGFCHAIVRRYGPTSAGQPPRLLSGAEREVRIRELLRGNAAGEGKTRWPAELAPALTLRGFAREVGDLLDRARERGLDGPMLTKLGERHHRPVWRAAGEFLDEYLSVLESRDEFDYAGLVAQAGWLLDDAAAELQSRFDAVYVDEYQDTDPSQERLLQQLAGDGRLLVAVGDPDQSIYGFRGADVRNILEFRTRFPHRDGRPADVVSLGTCRRMGEDLLAVSREFARKIPLGDLTRQRDEHRGLKAAGPAAEEPVRITLYPTVAEEVSAIADLVRRAHLVDGLRWDDMAVLVRSGVRSISVLRRALVAAGVPVSVASDEIPLARDPAVAPLLGALDVAAHGWKALTPDLARALLLSPLGGATPTVLRALGRRLRALDRAAGETAPRPSAVLIRDAVTETRDLIMLEDWVADPARRLSRLLTTAMEQVRAKAAPDEVLWTLWDGSGWSRRLAAATATTGAAGRAADRDLDAVVGLFDAAARLEDRRPKAGVSALLEEIASQDIPAAPLEERASMGGAVRLLTAHRSKGLEWDLVVVADVQDGVWPDLRRRGSLLEADAVDVKGPRPAPSSGQLLAEERRLFYVALTRARRRLVVTAVSGVDDESDRPSRFLDELGLTVPDVTLAGTGGLLSASSLVARLRRALVDEGISHTDRADAARRLADLATAVDSAGVPLVPTAHPDRWWGLVEPTAGAEPVRPTDKRISLSGSAVSSYEQCPRRWFLDREVHAQGVSTSSQGFGSVVHALAEAVVTGQLAPDAETMMTQLDTVWRSLPFDAEWQRDREHQAARELLQRFLRWHVDNKREVVGAEVDFVVDYGDDVVLRGRADRLERDDEGRLVVVDLKTSKYPPKDKDLPTEPQLGVYQLAVREGAFAERYPGECGGAELVQLRKETRGKVKVQPQPALAADDRWVDEIVGDVARNVRTETFVARPSDLCDRCAYRTSCPAVEAGQQVIS